MLGPRTSPYVHSDTQAHCRNSGGQLANGHQFCTIAHVLICESTRYHELCDQIQKAVHHYLLFFKLGVTVAMPPIAYVMRPAALGAN